MQPNHRGKTASGKTIPQRKEVVKIIEEKDAEIGRLLRRITYVEMVNNKTQAEADQVRSKHWLRILIIKLFTKTKKPEEAQKT